MFGSGKSAEEKRRERERKRMGVYKFGRTNFQHSRGGVVSCWCGGLGLGILAGCLFGAYMMRGNLPPAAGGILILSCVLAIVGVMTSVRGLRERERNYITCRIGLPLSGVVLLLFCVIFIGGIS